MCWVWIANCNTICITLCIVFLHKYYNPRATDFQFPLKIRLLNLYVCNLYYIYHIDFKMNQRNQTFKERWQTPVPRVVLRRNDIRECRRKQTAQKISAYTVITGKTELALDGTSCIIWIYNFRETQITIYYLKDIKYVIELKNSIYLWNIFEWKANAINYYQKCNEYFIKYLVLREDDLSITVQHL